MKVALVYDRVNKWGGAERVLLALHKIFPDAPLFTSVYNRKKAKWADVFEVKTSFLQKIPLATTNHEFLAPLMPLAFESFSFDDYDLVISITSESAKGIITRPGTIHISYCLTPTRYLWSGYDEYFGKGVMRFLSKPVVSYLKKWDVKASKRPDIFIAISKDIQKRIKKYYDRESEIIYPPVTLRNSKFEIRNSKQILNTKYKIQNTGYFLVVSRLSKFTKYKRIDLAIEAANELKIPLKIVGDGNMRQYLQKITGPTVEFVGSISDKELIKYYRNCRALIFPGIEDFGLVMVEAGMFGKPVIAFKGGGALEIVVDGKTGLFFEKQTKESLMDAILKFDGMKFNSGECIKNAQKYTFETFRAKFMSVVNKSI